MTKYTLSLIFALLPACVEAQVTSLQCDPERFNLADPYATYAYGEGYEKYEYVFDYLDAYWSAVAFHFSALPNTNPMLNGVTESDSDNSALLKMFQNIKASLIETSLADEVSTPSITDTAQGKLLTFATQSVVGRQHLSLFIPATNGRDKVIYRTHYTMPAEFREGFPEKAVLNVVQDMRESCKPGAR